jgi:restriction system protein
MPSTENGSSDVDVAFDLLVEEVEVEIESIDGQVCKAHKSKDYERAKDPLDRAANLAAFRERIISLRKEWAGFEKNHSSGDIGTSINRRNLGRLPRGVRTQEDDYFKPILFLLVECGGSSTVQDLMPKIEKRMKDVLNKFDYEPLSSNPDELRWRNSAKWARNTLVKRGLLRNDSPHSLWEISDAGRQWLKDNP